MAANKSLPGGGWPALRQSQRVVLRSAVEAKLRELREAQQAIEEDQQAREYLAGERGRIATRPKPTSEWEPEELEAASRPRPMPGEESEAATGGPGLHLFMPAAWRDSCPRLAELLEAAGLVFEAGEVRRLESSVSHHQRPPWPREPEDLPAWREANAEAVRGLIALLEPLARYYAGEGDTSVGKVTRQEAEAVARKLDRSDGTFRSGTAKQWAKRIQLHTGKRCSATTVKATDCWIEVMGATGRGKARGKTPSPKVFSLTPGIQATKGDNGEPDVLQGLIGREEEENAIRTVMNSGLLDKEKGAIIEQVKDGELSPAQVTELVSVTTKQRHYEPSPLEDGRRKVRQHNRL